MATRVVGLDIGTFAVRAAELSLGGQQPSLVRFGQVTLPVGAVHDGEIADVGAVSSAIRRLWSEGGFRTKKVVVGVANQRVIVRQADLPAMSEADLRAALKFEAQELIPIPVEDAILDFQILEEGITTGADADVRMRILLAAAQREMVRTHLAALEGAGLEATAVDVLPFALVRSLTLGANVFDGDGSAEAIICIGAGVTNVVVHEQGIPRFVRVLLVGGGGVTDAIARDLNVDPDTAEDLKRRADASSADASVARAGQIVAERVTPLVEEIRGSLDYYLAQSQSSPIGRILVTGGGSRMTGILERLQSQLGGRVEPARPLSAIATGDVNLSQAQLADIEPVLTVPVGLALAGEVQKGLRRISLLPREVAVLREQRRQATAVGGAVAGLGVLLLALWLAKGSEATRERHRADQAERRTEQLRQQRARLQDVATLQADLTQREAQARLVLADDVAWTRLLTEVATVIPSDVWITSFSGQRGNPGQVTFSLMGFDHTSTARWLLRIGDLHSLANVWVPASTKSGVGGGQTVTFTSNASLTAAARSDRAANFAGGAR